MPKQSIQNIIIVLLFALISCLCWSCGDEKEEPKAPVVSKKISNQHTPKAVQTDRQKDTKAPSTSPQPTVATESGAVVKKRIYDPENRLNPFIPLFRAEKVDMETGPPETGKKKRRMPQTPLEKIGLDQLKLVAVIRASSGNRGLVEDSSGKGYIIKNGTYIGLNSGIVTQINASSVIVEEEIENLMGEQVLQNTEIKLQKPAGE